MLQVTNILYPIDLDVKNVSPVVKAVEIAQMLNSTLHVLYVNDSGAGYRYPTSHEDAVALRVEEVVPQELLSYKKIIYAVAKGDLAKEISKYCEKNKIDLIITGHKHRNKLYSMLFDSPDETIIDEISLPVLVLPKE